MREDFMHYIWRFKLLHSFDLKTVNHQKIEILNFGEFTQKQGPDFFNALLKIDNQLWAGNIEMHLKASDWYIHNHEKDSNYNNVILHVVWEYDVDVFYPNNQKIPVLVLQDYVAKNVIQKYTEIASNSGFIPCQNQINLVPNHIWNFYKERLFLERLENKSKLIQNYATTFQSNWDQITFITLSKAFGLNGNGEIFEQMALQIPFSVFLKVRSSNVLLEALFFGMLNMLPSNSIDPYEKELVIQFDYLRHKFNLQPLANVPSFYKHRPDNFPTIRLSQLANLFASKSHLFDQICNANKSEDLYEIFQISTTTYWNTHFTFQSESKFKIKKTSQAFIQLIIINSVIPLVYSYNKSINKENIDDLIHLVEFFPPENNNTINLFNKLQLPIQSAFDTQALLQLKKNYCDLFRCLHCVIGKHLIQ